MNDYRDRVVNQQEGNALIRKALTKDEPLMVARCGVTELNCCSFNYHHKGDKYPSDVMNQVTNNAGVFPQKDSVLDKFSDIYIKSSELTDIMSVWYIAHENYICNVSCPKAKLIPLRSIEPYYDEKPWSMSLLGKSVLVVNPFAETIKSQYYNARDKLFPNPLVLPAFNLITYKCVQSIAGTKTRFSDWVEAYEFMCDEISKIKFDIALIGAGGYGLPLAAHIKSMGKKAVHIAGAIQILFGIKGLRWKEHEIISKFYNEYWTTLSKDEKPPNYRIIEGGCYW